MPFDLKNVSATYQRLVNKIFKVQIDRNMKVHVDDMLVKSKAFRNHIEDLGETFVTLRRYKMKLNPTKYAFGVTSDKFLGFIMSYRRIEANIEKIQAIIKMSPPRSIKKVQRLTDRVATLNKFVSRSTKHYLSFFQTLKQPKNF